jgi:plastocyanin
VADLSRGHPVPVGFTAAPDGGVFVGYLTPAPHTDGSAKIVKVTDDGQVGDVWTGLTTVTGIAVESDGTLLALEMATGNTVEGGMKPNTGRVVRQTGPASLVEVVTGLDYPIAMRFGPDGGLYVGFPAYGAADLDGAIVRIDLSQPLPLTMDPALLDASTCAVAQPPLSPPAALAPTALATPVLADLTPRAGQIAVEIKDFTFVPADLALERGATVTWTNRDSVHHTATGTTDGSFNSGNLDQGQTFSYTFDRAGEYSYVCVYHPYMTGTIVVK